MWKRVLGGILALVIALGGVFGIATVLTRGTIRKQSIQPAVRYLAEAELPNDAAAEKRRDFAVLEAALNDFESRNPTHDKSGSPVKVIVNHRTSPSGPFLSRIAEPIGQPRLKMATMSQTFPRMLSKTFIVAERRRRSHWRISSPAMPTSS
jgi:hypothetical protein